MPLRDSIRGFISNITGASRAPINVIPGLEMLEVVDTSKPPTNANIPGSWSRAFMSPGKPFSIPGQETARQQDAETEPRSFQYITSVNSTMSPRLAYGLTAFSDLRVLAESVPEVSMCLRLLTEEMKSFVPAIVDGKDNKVVDSEYQWMVEHPDRFNPFPVWLSRFLYNVLIYDAGCSYLVRDSRKKIKATRVIDGSTIFVVIDEYGEQPKPPAPAFQQIIWGTPRLFLNTHQLWYKPRHLRADAPYGRSPIEDSLPAVKLLQSLWDYEYQKYQIGNIPEMVITVPETWRDNVDAIFEFEEAFNARMSGSNEERARARFLPAGMVVQNTKELTFNKESYDSATNAVRLAFGIPQSEVGETSGAGLGGSGYAEAMQSTFYRMGLSPLMTYVESHFNDIITMNGDKKGLKFKLEFPPESLDPSKEEEKYSTRFQIGGISRDEYRQGISFKPLGGELGEFMVTPGGGAGGEEEDPLSALMGGGGGSKPGMINVGNKNNVQVRRPVNVAKKPVSVIKKPLSVMRKGEGLDEQQVTEIGNKLGIDWNIVEFDEFLTGINEEYEHADTVDGNVEIMAQIALDHIEEDPQYYTKLKALFDKYDYATLQKYCGVDPEDDMLFGTAVVNLIDTDMPKQGANESKIVSIGGGEVDARPAVWKPVSGEKPKLREWLSGELYRRAEAAYTLDRELSPDEKHFLIPVSYTTEVDGVQGSVQHYVIGRKARDVVSTYSSEWVERAAVLDYIMGQADRKNKNWLTHPHDDKRPVLIDSDLSFPPDPDKKIRSSFIDAMDGKPLSDKTLDMIYLALGNKDLWEDLQDILDDEQAVENARNRAQQLYDDKQINTTDVRHREILVKAEFEESKHPRDKDGKFASKPGGGAEAPPARRIGTSTVGRAKDIIEARRIQDEEEAKAKAGGKHVVAMRTSEKEEWERLKQEKEKKKVSIEQHKRNAENRQKAMGEFEAKYKAANIANDGDSAMYAKAYWAAKKLKDYEDAKANGRNPTIYEDEAGKYLDVLLDMDSFDLALAANDIVAANRIRNKYGVPEKQAPAKPVSPAPPAPKPVSVSKMPEVVAFREKHYAKALSDAQKFFGKNGAGVPPRLYQDAFDRADKDIAKKLPAKLAYENCMKEIAKNIKGYQIEKDFNNLVNKARVADWRFRKDKNLVPGKAVQPGKAVGGKNKTAPPANKPAPIPAGGNRWDDPIEHVKSRPFTSESKRQLAEVYAKNQILDRTDVGGGHACPTFRVKFKDDGTGYMKPYDDGTHGTINPHYGQYGFPTTEILGSEMSEGMGFDIVPAVGFRKDAKYGMCSVMQQATGKPADEAWGETYDNDLARDTASQLAVLTIVTGNSDRHSQNWFIDENTGRITAIDNGFSCAMEIFGKNPWGDKSPEDLCRRAWDHKMDAEIGKSIGYVKIPGWKVKQEHVDAAEKFIRSDGFEQMLDRVFNNNEFVSKMKAHGVGYKKLSYEQAVEEGKTRARRQIEAGLKFIKTKVT